MRPESKEPKDPRVGTSNANTTSAGAPSARVSHREEGESTKISERRSMELREEELVAHAETVPSGTVHVRREAEAVPAHLEVEAARDEVQLERVPIGQEVSERIPPWDEDGITVIPIYEEQLVVVKRLMLKEHVRVRQVQRTEKRLIEDTVIRERLVVDDPDETGQVREIYPTDREPEEGEEKPNLLERAIHKALD